jgi:hypothetical protein
MDIENTTAQAPQHCLFEPIHQFPCYTLFQQPVSLENTFTDSPQQDHPCTLLTLINDTLLLSDPNSSQVTPYAALNFSFDLKFEVLYQTNVPPANILEQYIFH